MRSSEARSMRGRLGGALAGLVVAGAVLAPADPALGAAGQAEVGPLLSYVVVTDSQHGNPGVERAIERAGGTVFVSYARDVGVIVARSTNPDFAAQVRRARGVALVGASRTAAIPASIDEPTVVEPAAQAGTTAEGEDPLEAQQWDMKQIKADQAHQVSLGSRRVIVGVLDSGVDSSHPDLAAQVDASQSVSCIDGGRPNTDPASWQPTTSGHGTHVAGTVAAAKNGVGIVGVAPGVRIASVKVADDAGFIYPEYAVCGFVWAGKHRFDITNNSYFVDPWLYNCPDDPDQQAISVAVQRAIAFANRNGVLSVSSAGNDNVDLANKTTDTSSPDDSTPVSRTVTNDCIKLPAEVPGVVAVSATGGQRLKASYSNYGLNVVDVAAPGGDRFQDAGVGIPRSVLSTLPGGRWGGLNGTSMASPHVAGVLALLASTHPHAGPIALRTLLELQADPQACPETYDIDGDGDVDAVCTDNRFATGFYGRGLADALDAVRPLSG